MDTVKLAADLPELPFALDDAELAAILTGCGSARSWRRWRRMGVIPPQGLIVLPSGRTRIRGSWVRQWLEQQTREA